ncbi:PREDICTED: Retrovirus-related Pol poly from transposon [Prunus dulcis]|uniref:PREDICTED: Retrovirus-related Pol poly from transposon n=1 Tax=Prunus dulcis TaxID=3755 RepID=A0A5E4FYR5_PRUDU|nr:hypothetical protein L3X38_023620 [Prunus dulcis]VVA32543.1 PREDICTED: Retrovirus-related Pol poly from transposon [Prunus dulcis]
MRQRREDVGYPYGPLNIGVLVFNVENFLLVVIRGNLVFKHSTTLLAKKLPPLFSCVKQDAMRDSLEDPTESVVGALQYLTLTRLEITFSMNQRILCYLIGTATHGIFYKPGPLTFTTYSDVDYAGDPITRRSTRGYCPYISLNLVSWSSKKQGGVSCSSTEAEYCQLAYTVAAIS